MELLSQDMIYNIIYVLFIYLVLGHIFKIHRNSQKVLDIDPTILKYMVLVDLY
jgi:hypothetical protein